MYLCAFTDDLNVCERVCVLVCVCVGGGCLLTRVAEG